MNRLRKLSLLAFFISIFTVASFGQTDNTSRYALNIGLGIEKVGIPFREVIDFPMHSSYHIGLERKWSTIEQKKSFQSLDIYAFTNTSAGSGYTMQTACGTRINITNSIYFSPSAGVGILHLFRPKESFILENGEYVPARDRGHMYPEVLINLKLGYQASKFGIFGSYQMGMQIGYSNDVPVLPRTFLTLGTRYEI